MIFDMYTLFFHCFHLIQIMFDNSICHSSLFPHLSPHVRGEECSAISLLFIRVLVGK